MELNAVSFALLCTLIMPPRVLQTGGPPFYANERFWRWKYHLSQRRWLRLVRVGYFIKKPGDDDDDDDDGDPLYRKLSGRTW